MIPSKLPKVCKNCNKIFTKGLTMHLKSCDKKYEFFNKYNISCENLKDLYKECGSVLSFMDKYPFYDNFVHYYKIFKECNVSVSVKEASNHENTKNKRKETSIKNSGYEHNFSKNSPSRLKWEKELFDNEGITNVFQREDVKRKSIKTIVEKYGKELWLHSITKRGKAVISKLNKKVFEILEEQNIPFEIEYKVLREDKYYYSYDILLANNKVIEVYGDYWHGNPKIYKGDDILLKGSSKEMLVKDKWEYDRLKEEYIKNQEHELLIIWEKDMKENIELIKSKILEYAKS